MPYEKGGVHVILLRFFKSYRSSYEQSYLY